MTPIQKLYKLLESKGIYEEAVKLMKEHAGIIKEDEPELPMKNDLEMIESGCDLTDFTPRGWNRFVRALGLKYAGRGGKNNAFLWKNDLGLTVATANNPDTGEYIDSQRKNEKGYASYMGAYGPVDEVHDFEEAVRTYAEYCKSGDLFSPTYISPK